jgi:drug/metabolite transporter (DMT)-like permease
MFLGVVVLRYQAPPGFSAGFWMMVLSSTLFGMTEVLVKTRVHTIPADVFVFVRNFFVFALSFLFALWRLTMDEYEWWGGLADWPGIRRGLPLIAAAAFVGPFIARTLYTYSIRHIQVSRAAIINQAQPLFVALFSLLLLRTLPSRREWTGGLLIIAGALILVHWRQGMSWWRQHRPHRPKLRRRRWRRRRPPS